MKNLARKAAAWIMTVILLVGYMPNSFAVGSVVSEPFKPGVVQKDDDDDDDEDDAKGTDYLITYHNHARDEGCKQSNHATKDQNATLTYISDNYRVDITSLTVDESGFELPENSTFLGWDFTQPGLGFNHAAGIPMILRPAGGGIGTDVYMNIQAQSTVLYYRNLNNQDEDLYKAAINPNNGGFNLASLGECSFRDIPNNFGFMGWSKNRDGKGKESKPGDWVGASSGTYYAIWDEFDIPVLKYKSASSSYTQDSATAKDNGQGSFTYTILSPIAAGMEKEAETKELLNWKNETTKYQVNQKITITKDTTLDAVWAEKLTITFKANWAAGTGNAPDTQKMMVGMDEDGKYSFNFPDPATYGFSAREGYTFVGWNVQKNGSGRSYVINDSLDVNESTTYYAIWLFAENVENNDAKFAIRKDGIEPPEPTKYPVSEYYQVIPIKNALRQAYAIYNNDGAVKANLLKQPGASEIKRVMPSFNPDTQYIRWYVIKLENDGWHVDGLVIDKAKFELVYSINGGQDNTRPATETGLVAGAKIGVKFSFQNVSGQTIKPTRSGYQFQGWAESNDAATAKYTQDKLTTLTMPAKNVTLYAVWAKRSDIDYTIEHYLQNSVGSAEYKLKSSGAGRGALESRVDIGKITKLTVAGYAYDHSNFDASDAVITVDENGDGSLVIKLYYNLSLYNVSYAYENAPAGVAPAPSAKQSHMGDTVTVAAAPMIQGYIFSGWKTSDAKVSGNQFTMPGTDVSFAGSFASAQVGAKVEYYLQAIGTTAEYELQTGETKVLSDVQTGDKLLASAYSSKNFAGFTYDYSTDEQDQRTVETLAKADGSTVLKLYYARNEYSVTYRKGGHGTLADSDQDGNVINTHLQYNASTPKAPAVTPENGYYFIGWEPAIDETVTENAAYTAQYSKKTALAITVPDKRVDYSGVAQDGNTEVEYNGLKPGDKLEISYTPAKGANAGSYTNGAFGSPMVKNSSNADVTNQYNITMTAGSLIINKLLVEIKVNNASKIFGSPDPAFTATRTGGIGAELEGLDLNSAIRTNSTVENGGKYTGVLMFNQNQNQLENIYKNYTFALTSGDFVIEINQNGLTVEGQNKVIGYDSAAHTIELPSITPLGATIRYGTSDNGTYHLEESPSFEDAGTYTIYFEASMAGYTSKQGSATLTITKAPVTITVANASKEYMAADPNFANATLAGSFGNELDGVNLEVGRSDKREDVGSYALNISKTAADLDAAFTNYTFNVTSGNFEISPNTSGVLTVSAPNVEKVYDGIAYGVVPAVTLTGADLLPMAQDLLDDVKILYKNAAGEYALTDCPALADVGTLTVDFEAVLDNFATAYGTATVTINARPIFISIDSDEKEYDGLALTAQGAVSSEINNANMGLAVGDAITDITLAGASLTDVGTSNPRISNVSIFNNKNDVTANYAVTATTDARLTVTPKALIVEIGNGNKIYDGRALAVEARVTGGLLSGHTASLALENNSRTNAGTAQAKIAGGGLKVLAGETDVTANYEIAKVTGGNITIDKRPVTIAVADAEKRYGTADPVFAIATMSGQVAGELGDISLAVSRSNAEINGLGTYENVLVTDNALDNLNSGYSNYSFTLDLGNFSIKASNALNVSATGIDQHYDGAEHAVVPKAFIGNTEAVDAVILYALSADGEYIASVPSFQNVTEQTIYIKATLLGYEDATCTATVRITPKPATIKVADMGKVYQAANPVFRVDSVTGGIGIELAELANLEIIRRNANMEDTAEYPNELTTQKTVTELNKEYTNYAFTVRDGIFIISNSGELAVSASNYNMPYDGVAHGIAAAATVEGATITYKNANGIYSATSPTLTNVGSTTVDFKAELANYETAFGTATITVTALPVSIAAMASDKVYGMPDPTFANAAISSFIGEELNGIDLAVVRGDAMNNMLGMHKNVLSIAQSAGALNAQYTNYAFTVTPADFVINTNITMAVSANDVTKVYDGIAYGVAPVANMTDATIRFMDASGGYTLEQSPAQTNVGSSAVQFKATLYGYEDAFGSATVAITPKSVTIAASANEKTYGDADPDFGNATISESIGAELAGLNLTTLRSDTPNDDLGVHTGVLSIAGTAQALNAEYTNYQFTVTPADFTINLNQRNDLTIAAQSIIKDYDGEDAGVAPAASLEGAVITYKNADGEYKMTQSPTLKDVGGITVEFKAELYGYADAFGSAVVTIRKRPVTIQAEASQKIYGSPDPDFTLATMTGSYLGKELIDGIDRAIIRSDATEDPMSTAAADLAGNAVGRHEDVLWISQSAEDLNAQYPNYLITVIPADFDIQENTAGLTANAESVEVTYDATAYGIEVQTSLGDATVLFADETGAYTLEQSPIFTNWGAATVKYQVKRTGFQTVTGSATIKIDQRPIRAQIASAEKMYDGLELTAEWAVDSVLDAGNMGYAPGDTISSATFTNDTLVDVGEVSPVLQSAEFMNAKSENVTQNYTLTSNRDAKVKITQRPIRIAIDSASRIYDGAALVAQAQVDPEMDFAFNQGLVAGHSAAITLKDDRLLNVGKTRASISAFNVTDQSGADKTENYQHIAIGGDIEVTLRPIRIVIGSAEKDFDGQPLSVNGAVDQKQDEKNMGLAPDEKVSIVLQGDVRTEVGSNDTTLSKLTVRSMAGQDTTGNYEITSRKGSLTVNPVTTTYTVRYFFNGVQDGNLTERLNGAIDGTVTTYSAKAQNGMRFDHVDGLPLRLKADGAQNVISVYYVSNDDLTLIAELETPLAGSMACANVGDCVE